MLPGASHSGKTTITTALAAAGHRFVADEVSRLDPDDLTIAPYGKPVALRAASVELLAPSIARLRRPGSRFEIDERFVPPSELGAPTDDSSAALAAGGIASQPVAVAAIVFPRFDGPAPTASPRSARPRRSNASCSARSASRRPRSVPTCSASSNGSCAPVPGHELVYTDLHACARRTRPRC